MTRYLLIESRDPFESRSFSTRCELAADLSRDGNEVTLILVENGVFAARRRAATREVDAAARAGVSVLADEFALRERGIVGAELASGIAAVNLEQVVQELLAGARTLWN